LPANLKYGYVAKSDLAWGQQNTKNIFTSMFLCVKIVILKEKQNIFALLFCKIQSQFLQNEIAEKFIDNIKNLT